MPELMQRMSGWKNWRLRILLLLCCMGSGCESVYPEVVVVNRTDEHILIKDISFNGCIWSDVIAYEEATSPGRCLPGADRVHFKKLDTYQFCREQVEDGVQPTLCICDTDWQPDTDIDEGEINEIPNWYNYRTLAINKVEYGEFYRFEITLDEIEQDFDVPGPFGH